MDKDQFHPDLLEWLHANIDSFFKTGSAAILGTGSDTDYILDIETLPRGLYQHLPENRNASGYDEDLWIVQDTEAKIDFILGSANRLEEFKLATVKIGFIREDCPDLWELIRANKVIRIGVFRALRFCHPDTELVMFKLLNPASLPHLGDDDDLW
jgi:hypothetical protein